MEYQVSVIVVSYNPVRTKLLATLKRILDQNDISLEIILCDDCSTGNNYFDEVRELFLKNNFANYKLCRNKVNLGIVNNFYGGILRAKGEYVFMASPGDYFYDECSLKCLYDFAKEKDAQICSGDAVYYFYDTKLNIVKNVTGVCYNKDVYDEDCDIAFQQLGCFFNNFPLGAIVLRKREYAVKYIGEIKKLCKWSEDKSVWLSVFDGIRIYHYNDFVLWYEYGTGLSTKPDGNHEIFSRDEAALVEYMCEKYPGNEMMDFYKADRYAGRIKRRILMWTKYLRLYLVKKRLQACGTRLKYRRAIDVSKFPIMTQ